MDTRAAIDAYLAGSNDLRAAVGGMTLEQLTARPIAGKWSVLEVVCHLADTDANIAYRLKRVLSEDRPMFERVKPDLMQAALAYHEPRHRGRTRDDRPDAPADGSHSHRVASRGLARTGIVGDRGEKTVAQMLTGAVEHLAHHLTFVVEKCRAMELGGVRS